MLRSLTVHRAPRFCLLLLSLVVLAGFGSRTAVAKTPSCADQVIADWYDDGRISKIYPLACYQQAIKKLPPDVLDYSNAKEEIGRALAFAKQGKPDPGGQDPTPTKTSSSSTTKTSTGKTSTSKTRTGKTATGKTSTTKTSSTGTEAGGGDVSNTSGPSSVPIPLLVLGGLAVLLLAAGSAGYIRRRMRGDDADGGTPPASA